MWPVKTKTKSTHPLEIHSGRLIQRGMETKHTQSAVNITWQPAALTHEAFLDTHWPRNHIVRWQFVVSMYKAMYELPNDRKVAGLNWIMVLTIRPGLDRLCLRKIMSQHRGLPEQMVARKMCCFIKWHVIYGVNE